MSQNVMHGTKMLPQKQQSRRRHNANGFAFVPRYVPVCTYKERHANSAPKIRLATMASHKARDGLSPRATLMRLVIMMQPVSASQSQYQNIPAPS